METASSSVDLTNVQGKELLAYVIGFPGQQIHLIAPYPTVFETRRDIDFLVKDLNS